MNKFHGCKMTKKGPKILGSNLQDCPHTNNTQQALARRKRGEGAGGGGFSTSNNLLKFIDFVDEKGCKSQGR